MPKRIKPSFNTEYRHEVNFPKSSNRILWESMLKDSSRSDKSWRKIHQARSRGSCRRLRWGERSFPGDDLASFARRASTRRIDSSSPCLLMPLVLLDHRPLSHSSLLLFRLHLGHSIFTSVATAYRQACIVPKAQN